MWYLIALCSSWALSLPMLAKAQATAERQVQCEADRALCEEEMLHHCPDGATILGESLRRVEAGAGQGKRFRLRYRCGMLAPAQHQALHEDWIRRMQAQQRSVRLGPAISLMIGSSVALGFATYALSTGKRSRIPLGVGLGVPAGALLVGSALLLRRGVRKRRAIARELEQYAARRVDWAWAASRGSVGGQLRMRF